MSKIDKLIEELCPNGVAIKTLGSVTTALRTGLNPRKNFDLNTNDAQHFYVTVRELDGFGLKFTEKTDKVTDEGLRLIQNRAKVKVGDVLFSATGTIGRTALVAAPPHNWGPKEGVYIITPDPNHLDPSYLIYALGESRLANAIREKTDGSTVISIPMSSLRQVKFPLPPLEIQREIVRVLNTFKRLESELEAELEARRVQYAHYKDMMLSFRDQRDVASWVSLGELAEYSTLRVPAHSLHAGNYVGVDNLLPNARGKTNSTYGPNTAQLTGYEPGYILLGNIRPYLKKIWLADTKGGCSGDVLALRVQQQHKQILMPKFLYYLLSADAFFSYNMEKAKGAKMPRGSKEAILKYKIPLPPVKIQQTMVDMLGNFDALVNDLGAGLPAELKLRRQQYEYYRDRLLTFPEAQ